MTLSETSVISYIYLKMLSLCLLIAASEAFQENQQQEILTHKLTLQRKQQASDQEIGSLNARLEKMHKE